MAVSSRQRAARRPAPAGDDATLFWHLAVLDPVWTPAGG